MRYEIVRLNNNVKSKNLIYNICSKKEQQIDSTMFMSNIKKAGRVALAFDVLYRAVKSIPEDRLFHAGVKKGQTAHFPKEACAKCELKNQCYCKEQKKDYVVRVNLKSIEAAKQREKIECKCEENKSKRAAIEGTNSALKRGHGLSKLRVRGLVKCRVNVGLKVLAQNFKRFARYMLERAKKAIAESQGGSVPVLVQ